MPGGKSVHHDAQFAEGLLGLPMLEAAEVGRRYGRADAVVIGLPFDGGTTSLPGQRHGPEILRKLGPSAGFRVSADGQLGGVVDPVRSVEVLAGRRIFDLGDLGGVPIDPRRPRENYYRAIADTGRQAVDLADLVVFIGGDHSVTAATVKGVAEAIEGPIDLVCFDAHCDVGPADQHVPDLHSITHANFLNFLDHNSFVASSSIVGVRAMLTAAHLPLPKTVTCLPHVASAAQAANSRPVYLSIDVDVLSPEVFPGTGHPEPGGLTFVELCEQVDVLARGRKIVAMDIVETTYSDRWNEESARVASALLLNALRSIFDAR